MSEKKTDKKLEFCFICKKTSHILNKCRCGNTYCLKHASCEKHNCTFDFKSSKTNLFEKIDNRITHL